MDEEKKDEISTSSTEETKVENAPKQEVVENEKVEEKAVEQETKKEETKPEEKEELKKEEVKKEEREEPKKEEKTDDKKEEMAKEEPKVENITSKKSSSSKAPIIVGIIAILLIAIAAVIFYFMNMTASADKVFKNILNAYKVEATKNLDVSNAKSMKSSVSLDVDLKLEEGMLDQDIVDLINALKLDMNIEMDLDKDNIAYNIVAKNNKDDLLNADLYITEEAMYAKLNGLLDKYLKLELTDIEFPEIDYVTTYRSEKIIIESVIDALNDSLKTEYFKQEKLDKDVKNTLILDNANLKAIINDALTILKDNEEFVKEMASIIDEDEETLKTDIADIMESIGEEELLPDGVKVELSIFTKKMSTDVTRVHLDFMQNDEVQTSIVLNVVSDEEITYEIPISAREKITGSIVLKSSSDEKADMSISLNYSDYIELTLNMSSTYKLDKSKNIELPDFKNAVKIEDLTEEDAEELLENIQNNEALKGIFELVGDYGTDLLGKDNGYDEDDDDRMTVANNILEYDKYKIKFNIPKNYEIDSEYSTDQYKYFEYEDDDSEVEAYIRITYQNADDYFEHIKDSKYDYKLNYNGDFYKNVEMSDIKEEKFGDNTVKYVELSYNAGKTLKYDEIYAIYELDDKYSYIIEIESMDKDVPEDVFESFATFSLVR